MPKQVFKLILITLFIFTAVAAYAETPKELFNAKVDAAAKVVTQIEASELMSMIKSKKDITIIDVREKNEVEAGKIEAGTYMHSPRGLVDIIASMGAISPEKTYVIYCKKGSRGLLAAKALVDLGFKNVFNLKDGIHGWMAAGYPITNSLGTFKTVPYELTGCAEAE